MLPMAYKEENPRELDRDLEAIRKEVAALDAEREDSDAQDQTAYARLMAAKAQRFQKTVDLLEETYRHLSELNMTWRRAIFCGEMKCDADADRNLRSLFAQVGMLCEHMKEKANYYERHGVGSQSHFAVLDQRSQDARQTYLAWQTPKLSASPALRTLYVSGDELVKARALFSK
jgi:hypothetical protein